MKPIGLHKDLTIDGRGKAIKKRNGSPKPAIEKLIFQKKDIDYNAHKGLITAKSSGNKLPYPFNNLGINIGSVNKKLGLHCRSSQELIGVSSKTKAKEAPKQKAYDTDIKSPNSAYSKSNKLRQYNKSKEERRISGEKSSNSVATTVRDQIKNK